MLATFNNTEVNIESKLGSTFLPFITSTLIQSPIAGVISSKPYHYVTCKIFQRYEDVVLPLILTQIGHGIEAGPS